MIKGGKVNKQNLHITIMTEEINGIIYCLDEENLTAVLIRMIWRDSEGEITIPETIMFNGVFYRVTSIEDRAFSGCSLLTSVTIPDSIKSIGMYVFQLCSSLTSITIPNGVKSIERGAFSECSSLTTIVIPDSVTSIGENAFVECESLKAITIPDCVTSIGDWAFGGCKSLTSIIVPKSVTSIGMNVFVRCSSLTSIVVASGNTKYDSREECNAIIETRNNSLMYGCQTSIIPNGVESIGYRAFAGCSSLTSITIPDSVGIIEEGAFEYCEKLTSVTIPNSVCIIEDHAFEYCKKLTSITLQGTIAQWKNIESYCYRNLFTTFPFKVVHCTDGDVEI